MPVRLFLSCLIAFVVVFAIALGLASLLSERPLDATSFTRNAPHNELPSGYIRIVDLDARPPIQWQYYLDPPSPPYCTPFSVEPGCFPFGGVDPSVPSLSEEQKIVPMAARGISDLQWATVEQGSIKTISDGPREVRTEQIKVASGDSYQLQLNIFSQTKVGSIVVFDEMTMAGVDYQVGSPDIGRPQQSRMQAIFEAARPFLDRCPNPRFAITAWQGDQPTESCYFDLLSGAWSMDCHRPVDSE